MPESILAEQDAEMNLFNQQIMSQIHMQIRNMRPGESKNYKVFQNHTTGLSMVMRDTADDGVPGYCCTHGPDTFSSCLKVSNTTMPKVNV